MLWIVCRQCIWWKMQPDMIDCRMKKKKKILQVMNESREHRNERVTDSSVPGSRKGCLSENIYKTMILCRHDARKGINTSHLRNLITRNSKSSLPITRDSCQDMYLGACTCLYASAPSAFLPRMAISYKFTQIPKKLPRPSYILDAKPRSSISGRMKAESIAFLSYAPRKDDAQRRKWH